MVEFNRRTYLKGALASAATLAGIGSVSALRPPGGGPPQGGNNSGAGPSNRECPPGTTQLAKYETEDSDGDDDEEFVFAEGDDVITFSDIHRNDEGEIQRFDWEASDITATVAVKFGPETELFEGGFEGEVDLSERQNAISHATFCAPRGGRAVLCELDMTGAYETEFHLDGDPASGSRDGVVHIESNGRETTDYGHAMVNVLQQLGERIKVSDLDGVAFDIFEGSTNTGTIPDELFVSLLTEDDNLKLAVRHVDASSVSSGAWAPYALGNDIDTATWSVEDVSLDDLRTSTSAIDTARDLRDTPDQNAVLATEFENATLAGVGIGAGNTRKPTTIDRYFDNLTINWANSHSATFDFPAVVPVTVGEVERRGNNFIVDVTFQQSEQGLSFNDVANKSVTLNTFGQFAPPIEIGVAAKSVRVRNDTLTARFPARAVDDELERSKFIISGDFDIETGTAFFGVGTDDTTG